MNDDTQQHDHAVIADIISQLRRHFDHVQVFANREDPGQETVGYSAGAGNWYARLGQVQVWLDNGGAMDLNWEDVPGEEQDDE